MAVWRGPCLFLIVTWRVLSVFSQTISTPGDVVAGRPFTLECRINRTSVNTDFLSWSHHLNRQTVVLYDANTCTPSITLSSSSPAGLSGGCHQDNGEEVYTVRIDNVTEDTGLVTWTCQYGFNLPVARVTLDVKVRVAQVRVQNLPSTVLEGTSTTFTCVTSRSKPRACIRGYIRSSGNVRELGPTDCNQDSTYNTTSMFITTRTLRFTAKAEDNGAVLYCTADNSVTDPPVPSQNQTLDVQYPPFNGIRLTSSYVNNTPIESGVTVTLTCQVGKGNPRPVLTWTPECGQTNTDSGNDGGQQISISITVSPSLNRKSCFCEGTQDRTGWNQQKSWTINVSFGPDNVELQTNLPGNTATVTENSTVTFTCNSSESNPAVVLSWYNNNSPIPAAELSEVMSERGSNLGYLITQRYTVKVDRYQDGNVIRCEARRSDQTTSKIPQSLTLDVRYVPKIICNITELTVFEGQTVKLWCDVITNPAATIIWLRDGNQVDGAAVRNIRKSDLNDTTVSSLELESTGQDSSGVFQIEATNSVGSSRMDIDITVIAGQFIPQEIHIDNCAENTAKLIWASGIDNSVVQFYKLEYKAASGAWTRQLVRNPGRVQLVKTTVKDLQTNVMYSFRLQPYSDIALSDYATANCTIKESRMSETQKNQMSGIGGPAMLGIGLVVGILGVSLVVFCVAFWLRWKGSLTWQKDFPGTQDDMRQVRQGSHSPPRTMGHYEDLDTRPGSGTHYEELSGQGPLPNPTDTGEYENAV